MLRYSGSLCPAAIVCDSRMVPPISFPASSFRLYWPCPFFFGSTVSFCLALSYFFLRWYLWASRVSTLAFGHALVSSVPMHYAFLTLSVGFLFSASLSALFFRMLGSPASSCWLVFSFSGYLPLYILLCFQWLFPPELSTLS